MQNPTAIKPEIGKLSKSIVDSILLVNYIPAPPLDVTGKETLSAPQLHPPKPAKQRMRLRLLQNFTFFTSRSSNGETSDQSRDESERKADSWADNWEQGQYPFVTLEGNWATCAICLNDFEAPAVHRRNGKWMVTVKITTTHRRLRSQPPPRRPSPGKQILLTDRRKRLWNAGWRNRTAATKAAWLCTRIPR